MAGGGVDAGAEDAVPGEDGDAFVATHAAIGPLADGSHAPSPIAAHEIFVSRPAAQNTTELPSHFGSISLSHSTLVGT